MKSNRRYSILVLILFLSVPNKSYSFSASTQNFEKYQDRAAMRSAGDRVIKLLQESYLDNSGSLFHAQRQRMIDMMAALPGYVERYPHHDGSSQSFQRLINLFNDEKTAELAQAILEAVQELPVGQKQTVLRSISPSFYS